MPRSITHGDVFLAYFNKIWGIPLREESKFSEVFMAYILARNARVEEDLVDQLFNSSEKRLARVLLLMAHFGKEGKPEPVIAVRF
jgi:CRP/FNR family transcriptional regulator, cyclic AMP receptor protein